jgi:cellulose synthase operon protein C
MLPVAAASLSALLLLSACDSAEERAETHYNSAVELIAAGDVDRAIVELRNVFQLNSLHLPARRLYAATMLERGNMREALGSYTLVSEQDPADDRRARGHSANCRRHRQLGSVRAQRHPRA